MAFRALGRHQSWAQLPSESRTSDNDPLLAEVENPNSKTQTGKVGANLSP